MSWKELDIILRPLSYNPFIGDFIILKINEPIGYNDYEAGIKICESHNCTETNYGVYFISDEPIIKDDWYYSTITGDICRALCDGGEPSTDKKIVASSDKSLQVLTGYDDISHMPIYLSLPKIPINWLKVYVSRLNTNEKITKVNVEHIEKRSYHKSGMFDINGIEIIEGSIINGDGYKSDLNEHYFHCVEYNNGIFGSDIYSDFEPLSSYNTIEVIGHISDFPEIINGEFPEGWSGNFGSCYSDKVSSIHVDSNNTINCMIESHDNGLLPIDSIKTLIGYIDTPIGRRKYPKEVVESAQELRKWIENNI